MRRLLAVVVVTVASLWFPLPTRVFLPMSLVYTRTRGVEIVTTSEVKVARLFDSFDVNLSERRLIYTIPTFSRDRQEINKGRIKEEEEGGRANKKRGL